VAVLLSRAHWNQDIFEGWIMLAAAFFVTSHGHTFMMRTDEERSSPKGQIEGKLETLPWTEFSFRLFAFIFLMLREGVGTVLILGDRVVSLNTTQLLSFLGHCSGWALPSVRMMFVKRQRAGWNLQNSSGHTFILFFVAVQLLVSGLNELSENGVLPSPKQEMAFIGPIVRQRFLLFLFTIFAPGPHS